MRCRVFALSAILPLLAAVFLSCSSNLTSPYDPSNAKMHLLVKSSTGIVTSDAVTDTVGNTVNIGINGTLSTCIDSVKLWVTIQENNKLSDSVLTVVSPFTSSSKYSDTAWYNFVFNDTGIKVIKGTAYIQKGYTFTDSINAIIYPKRANRKPVLSFTGKTTVKPSESCVLVASVNDSDANQKDSIIILQGPSTVFTFISSTFVWTPPSTFTGMDSVTFIAFDNGEPVLYDTLTVHIIVSDTASKVNHPPIWQDSVITLSGCVGNALNLTLTNYCSDPDSDALTFSLIAGTPATDTISASIYTFTPTKADTEVFYPKIIAKDPAGLSDTVTLHITIIAAAVTDNTVPTLRFLSPSKDTIISTDSVKVQVICKDASGLASLKCMVDTASFTTTKSATADSVWSATVKGLKGGQYSTIKFIATDSSSAANKDSVSIKIKYDNDTTKPTISLVTPSKDTVSTNAGSYMITLKCTDASGIASVIGVINSVYDTGTKETDSTYSITVNNLTQGVFDTVKITVTDNSLKANKATTNIKIKYDSTLADAIGPVINKISGPKDTVSSASFIIVDSITDPSGIDSVYAVLNNGTKSNLVGTNNKYSVMGTFSEGTNTIVIMAKDKSAAGNISTQTINVYYLIAPTITIQPVAQTACPSTSVSFSVSASGTRPLTYKWYKGSTIVVTDSTYTKSSVAATDSGYYKVVVSNGSGSVTSDSVMLAITKYTVAFVSNGGGSIDTQKVICNGTATTPTAPTRNGYIFAGWYSDEQYNSVFIFTTLITGNITLYAKWTAVYTVTYMGNGNTGGSVPVDGNTYINGNTVTVLGNTGSLTKANYTFSKWNTSADGSGTYYTSGSTFVMGSSNMTLYAQWVIDTFIVTFDGQSPTVAAGATSIKAAYGNTISLPTAPTKIGCTFAGWWTEKIGSGTQFTASTIVTANDTVYAKWIMTDYDGNEYNTVTIGTQTWTVENLRTTHYTDGTAIPLVTDSSTWGSLTSAGYCWYNNDSATYNGIYGKLYNGYVIQTGLLAPSGWHVPTLVEWDTLSLFLGGDSVSGGKLKEAGTTIWSSPNIGATNEIGFTALPGGGRSLAGYFNVLVGNTGCWWTTSTRSTMLHYYLCILYYNSAIRDYYLSHFKCGGSVRLLRD